MGKRKNKKNSKQRKFPKSKLSRPVAFIIPIILTLGLVYWYTKPPTVPQAAATGQLIENRPILSPAGFTGKAALAYRYAAEIPKVIDSQFCYCYCKRDHGHKTLLTCFTNKHGSECDVCIEEVLYSYQLYKEGKTIDEIVVAIDKKFYRPYKRHM